MRILSGKFKNRRIYFPRTKQTRPIPANVRKALFDILGEKVKGSNFLDLFAGSGIVGIEALSRDAKSVTFVDKGNLQVSSIKRNLENLGIKNAVVYKADILKGLSWIKDTFDIIFIAPPYEKIDLTELLKVIKNSKLLKEDTLLVLQHSKRECLDETIFKPIKKRIYGDTILTFLRA